MTYTEMGKFVFGKVTENGRVAFSLVTEKGTRILSINPTPPTGGPIVTIISVSKSKISDEPGMNVCTLKFSFDRDVQAWSVRVLGVSFDTGTVAASGATTITAGTEILADIDWTELYQEGANRINIYGQAINGAWTEYGQV